MGIEPHLLLINSPFAHQAVMNKCHVGDFSWVTSAPSHAISVHYIQKTIFNALLRERNFPLEELWHQDPRGCFFDFCAKKEELSLKLRTADICAECMSIFDEIPISDALLQQTVSIMEALRRLALNTAPYLAPDHVDVLMGHRVELSE